MQYLNLTAKGINTFIPSGDQYERALSYTRKSGLRWVRTIHISLYFHINGYGFILQNYKNDWALGNFMMVLDVENLDDWWTNLSSLDLGKI
jgi:hypothetical protein